ncbi:Elongation of very long chain fatty acids protein 4 [Bulinus truncatus]|nr:Elongation of very long chain fatty acids protein 4 [Bulinus truncatus]
MVNFVNATTEWTNMREWILLYDKIMEHKDPRFDGFPMMDSPMPMFLVVLFYLVFVFLGAKWMKGREPFRLRRVLLVYNCSMICLSLYLFSWATFIMLTFGYSMNCKNWIKYDIPDSSSYVYFILRKKLRQLTFLHVYHHGLTVVVAWFGLRFVPGGPGILYIMLNSFIHSLVYTYYAVSSLRPDMTKYLRWKKCLTVLQILQLSVFVVQGVIYQIYDCPFARFFMWIPRLSRLPTRGNNNLPLMSSLATRLAKRITDSNITRETSRSGLRTATSHGTSKSSGLIGKKGRGGGGDLTQLKYNIDSNCCRTCSLIGGSTLHPVCDIVVSMAGTGILPGFTTMSIF